MIRQLLIDPFLSEIRPIPWRKSPPGVHNLTVRQLLGATGYEIASLADTGDELLVDNYGRFRPRQHYFRLNGLIFAGRAIVRRRRPWTQARPPKISIEDLRARTEFIGMLRPGEALPSDPYPIVSHEADQGIGRGLQIRLRQVQVRIAKWNHECLPASKSLLDRILEDIADSCAPSTSVGFAAEAVLERCLPPLREKFGVPYALRTGSFGNRTDVFIGSDVDYLVAFRGRRIPRVAEAYARAFENTLRSHLPEHHVTFSSPAIVIADPSDPTVRLDLIPARLRDRIPERDGWGKAPPLDGIEILSESNEWMPTLAVDHKEFVGRRDRILHGSVKRIIRLFKLWRHIADAPIRSVYLELAISKMVGGQTEAAEEYFRLLMRSGFRDGAQELLEYEARVSNPPLPPPELRLSEFFEAVTKTLIHTELGPLPDPLGLTEQIMPCADDERARALRLLRRLSTQFGAVRQADEDSDVGGLLELLSGPLALDSVFWRSREQEEDRFHFSIEGRRFGELMVDRRAEPLEE